VNSRLLAFPLAIALLLVTACSNDDPAYKPDTTAPVMLSGPTISDITWDFLVPAKDMNLVREHSILIASSSLDVYGVDEIPPGTLVYYSAASRNAAGLTTRTPLASFTTSP
jgi:hypothetical protein